MVVRTHSKKIWNLTSHLLESVTIHETRLIILSSNTQRFLVPSSLRFVVVKAKLPL